MCEYIRSGVSDPAVRAAAEYAWRHFAGGRTDPAMLAWAAFWYVKHCVKFRQDEATMFRIRQQGEFDLLISPGVLVRMQKPAEDCDGFTMLVSAICTILGVPVVIATVAVDPDDRRRWSHVFPCALLDGGRRVLPLDASHGVGPGWKVPDAQIFRYQAFDLDGRRVDVRPTSGFRGLHGYVRRSRGMGDCVAGVDSQTGDACEMLSFPQYGGASNPTESPYPVVFTGTPNSSGGTDWKQLFSNLAADTSSALAKVFAPPAYQQTVRDPVTGAITSTTVSSFASPSSALNVGAGGISGLAWVGIGALAIFALVASSKRSR